MTARYPRIRYRGRPPVRYRLWNGDPPRLKRELLARDVICFAFYLPHDHPEIAEGIAHAVDVYLRVVGQGPGTIHHSFTNEDEGDALTVERWQYIRRLLRPERPFRFIEDLPEDVAGGMEKRGYATRLLFNGGASGRSGYELTYRARIPRREPSRASVSLLYATLPTEYIEEHGAIQVRELALEMGSMLRFASGHVGLALRLYWPLRDDALRARYPGWPVCPSESDEQWRGVHVDGVHWLNFLGPPVLDALGGIHSLRARLCSIQTSVHELSESRAVVSLGEWPAPGSFSGSEVLPAYKEFARVLEPWLALR